MATVEFNKNVIGEKILKANVLMTEDRFWKIVDGVNWAEASQNTVDDNIFDTSVARLEYELSPREIYELRAIMGILINALDKSIGERNPARGSDDSHSDLMYHIVGLGRDAYYDHLSDYELIEDRGRAPYGSPEGYRESFSYMLPYSKVSYQKPKEEKIYRITWRHEVYIKAENDEDAKEKWENIDLGLLHGEEIKESIESHAVVEQVSFECESEDYREVV